MSKYNLSVRHLVVCVYVFVEAVAVCIYASLDLFPGHLESGEDRWTLVLCDSFCWFPEWVMQGSNN